MMQRMECEHKFNFSAMLVLLRTVGKWGANRKKRAAAALLPNYVHADEFFSCFVIGNPVPDITKMAFR